MRILVLNRGSSSLKCSLYEDDRCLKEMRFERNYVLEEVIDSLCPGPKEIDAIGHRIVHGGCFYEKSVLIDTDVKKNIRSLSELAPLHNLADLEGIEILEKLFPGIPQVAVFDTAFHHSLPEATKIYPGPYAWFEAGIQRYGFHGMSFQYCSRKVSEMMGKDLKMVICHLGSGASLCAIKEGKSFDTTMGFTPLEGLMMDTRSGSIDPGILLYLLSKKEKTVEALSKELYEESGLLGLSGLSGDMREVLKKEAKGNPRARLSIEVYLHRLKREIGSMIAILGGLDVLVFTAGIGENIPLVREKVCEGFAFLGVQLDKEKNKEVKGIDSDLSLPDSQVKVLLIHTQESFEIARECRTVLGILS